MFQIGKDQRDTEITREAHIEHCESQIERFKDITTEEQIVQYWLNRGRLDYLRNPEKMLDPAGELLANLALCAANNNPEMGYWLGRYNEQYRPQWILWKKIDKCNIYASTLNVFRELSKYEGALLA